MIRPSTDTAPLAAAAEQYANCLRNATTDDQGAIRVSRQVADGIASTLDDLRQLAGEGEEA